MTTTLPARPAAGRAWLTSVPEVLVPTVRGLAAAATSALIGLAGPAGLGVLAFVLIPACSSGDASPALMAVALGIVLAAAVAPVAVAGARLWWIGVPAAALAVHGVLPLAWSLLTERQSGFCF